jgi:hypothetical protein
MIKIQKKFAIKTLEFAAWLSFITLTFEVRENACNVGHSNLN